MTTKATLMGFLKDHDFITLDEAQARGVNKMVLSRMVAAGELYRPARKIYTRNLDWLTDPLGRYTPACTLYPDAVICGVSALTYYDLTDEEERKVWLAFPQEHRVVNREYRIIYPSGISYSLGIEKHQIGNREVRIYSREKSIVDAFKYLPVEIAHKVLREYLHRKDRNLEKLIRYSKQLKKPLDKEISILLSD